MYELRSELDNSQKYHDFVERRAADLESDGCSGVPEFYHWACLEHDIHYRTHSTVGTRHDITKREADRVFRWRIQQRSRYGFWSPMSWWRWLAVALFGWRAWRG